MLSLIFNIQGKNKCLKNISNTQTQDDDDGGGGCTKLCYGIPTPSSYIIFICLYLFYVLICIETYNVENMIFYDEVSFWYTKYIIKKKFFHFAKERMGRKNFFALIKSLLLFCHLHYI